ncbi:ABC transporter ATP-binding protein [Companilactobacillus sp.]|jgi:putative ABC transport system ATP-binding protein|uniref:ABC transporter ATP-binding protein n=1 Tax=Companilactobacillus sp. TaxID=2767905 RepID=UPI0025BCDBF6|nr:ABC transporter ATP-binding protein [Companilactobacillus sp.]MCH4009551.1 ABC transporter ATP-binding protein [Companilactobacillus sp.]MCH4052773.1 ABC transporter ATP-binding protein [Companilactobacillus sp.]MCH4077493.1 ABC transporter ATP-binding protein [Companilactobacillus sp.]MCH4126069.1 ABC transporter ATP-binding protein [Companilactobacillus sp.]MCI1311777.1 ABC transporter ATP-binding protein [Companilactobacillus sp.]
MTKIVEVNNIEKIYGKANEKQFKALSDVNFEVQPGEFVGIMGASGSGKTTLLNILSTLDTPTSGEVKIAGEDITKLNNNEMADFRANKIGFIFQDFNLLENLTAYENIALPLALQNRKPSEIKPAVMSISEKLGLTDILNHYPTELSGGQKQRVAAARALVHGPEIIFGDEPTGALDSKSARALMDTMTKINHEDNVSILLVTHDPFSASFCDRILFIKDGEIGQELKNEEHSRGEFYQEILDSLGTFAE